MSVQGAAEPAGYTEVGLHTLPPADAGGYTNTARHMLAVNSEPAASLA